MPDQLSKSDLTGKSCSQSIVFAKRDLKTCTILRKKDLKDFLNNR